MTEQCNIECSHCLFRSSPKKQGRMERNEAVNYIDQANDIPTIEWISFTGGEPFLEFDLLKKLVAYASKRGLKTECITNCFWADSATRAERYLKSLVIAGLDNINISADDFHQHFIPFNIVHNCYEAAKKLGLNIVIMCTVSKSSKMVLEEVIRLLGDSDIQIIGYEKKSGNISALAIETGFIPVGRGEELPLSEWTTGRNPLGGSCRNVLRDIAISPSGRVHPCCSSASLVQEVDLGNVKQEKLADIMVKARLRPIFKVLASEGPLGLKNFLGETQYNFVNKCHLCYKILTNPKIHRMLY